MSTQNTPSSAPIAVHHPERAIDITNSSEVRDAMLADVESGTRALIVDLESVRYVDSSGLSSLVNVATAVEGNGGRVFLCHVDPSVHKVLEMTRLTEYFVVVEDRDEATRQAQSMLED